MNTGRIEKTERKEAEKRKFSEFTSWFSLLMELVKKDVVLKYRKAHLGILWILIEPLILSGVYYLIFYRLYDRNDRSFIAYILIGRLFYSMLRNGTTAAGNSIIRNQNLIKKFNFPKVIIPLSAVTAQFVFFMISLLDLIPIFFILGIHFSWNVIQVFIPLLLIYFLTLALGYVLTVAETIVRDVIQLWNIIMMFIMYSSAIFFSPGKIIRSGYQWIFEWNPLYRIIELARNILLYKENLSLAGVMYPAVFCMISLFIGISLFQKLQKLFIFYI